MEVKNYLLGYKDMYIYQDTEMFNFSLDSVLLPGFMTINSSVKNILDIGTGNAPIPLIISTKSDAHITAVEIQEEVFNLAKKSVKENHLQNQIDIICDDINNLYERIESDSFDIITCNPPYFKTYSQNKYNKNDYKTIARHEVKLNLEQLLKISRKLLKNKGNLDIVHRTDRLVDIIELMRENNIEPKRIRLVYPKKDQESNMVLIEGTKNGQPGLKIMPPLYVHDEFGKYTSEVLKYFELEVK